MAQSDVITTKFASATNWALWRCNESSGNLSDSSGNGFTLIARGTPTYSQAAVEGTGIAFDGTNDEAATALITPIGTTLPDAFTMGFNVKGSPQASKALMALSNGAASGGFNFLTGTSAGVNDDKLRIQLQNSAGTNIILTVSGPTILDGTWHNVVAVGSGGNSVKVFVDGAAQTPLSATWSTSRPSLKAAAIAAIVLSDTLPQNPSIESAITVENAFVGDIALADQDVVDIYNAGSPDTTPPELASAVVAADGLSVVLTFTEVGSVPILPSTGVTGFSLSRLGSSITISSATRTDDTEITLVPSAAIAPGPVLLSYSGGNVTDGSSNALEDIADFTVTNNSTTETYAAITMLASTASRMAPHTVFVTAEVESVPVNGNWRYVSASWNFGDGSTVPVLNQNTGRLQNATTDQASFACASHTYETPGTYTITLTLTGQDGVTKTATQSVTVVADTRTTKYLDSSAGPGGDGSESTPWSTHAEMIADLASSSRVMMSGTFDLTEASELPVVSNVVFQAASGGVTFHWTSNPASDDFVFKVPQGAENILIDGKTGTYTSRGIVVTSDVGLSTTKSDNQTGFLQTFATSVKCRNVNGVGDIASGGVLQGAVYGGNAAFVTQGLAVENCDFGDCNNYLSVFTRMEYVCWLGGTAGTAWIEHTQRWLYPASKHIAGQWFEYDHKRINNGSVASSGQASKDCVRLQSVDGATLIDCKFRRGVVDFSYPWGANDGEYGPGYKIQVNRCIFDDCGIYIRPDAIDTGIMNSYLKDAPLLVDIGSIAPIDKVMDKFSFLHNTCVDTSGAFSFLDFSVLTNSSHAFDRTNIDVDGNLFCTASGQTGAFIVLDDSDLWSGFTSVDGNVMTDGLSGYIRTKNAATQATTDTQDWATFTGDWPDNFQETIESSVIDALTKYRPDAATYPVTTAAANVNTAGVLQRDLFFVQRATTGVWSSGCSSEPLVVIDNPSFLLISIL